MCAKRYPKIGRMMTHAKDTKVDSLGDYAPSFSPRHAAPPIGNRDADGLLIHHSPVLMRYNVAEFGVVPDLPSRMVQYFHDMEVTEFGLRVGLAGDIPDSRICEMEGPNGERVPGILVLGRDNGETDADGTSIIEHVGPVDEEQFLAVLIQREIAEALREEGEE